MASASTNSIAQAAAPVSWPGPRRRLRILLLASRVPDANGRADQRTVFRWLQFMAARGHRIHLIALDTWECPGRANPPLHQFCERIEIFRQSLPAAMMHAACGYLRGLPLQVGAFWNPRAARAVQRARAEREFDLVYAHLIRTAEYARLPSAMPRVLAMQVAQSLNLERMARHARGQARRIFYRFELRAVRNYERTVGIDFDRCAVISTHDRSAIGLVAAHTWLMPHGVDLDEFRPAPRRRQASGGPVVMSGVLNTATNIEAASWMLTEIWPRVRARLPGASLRIVGRDPAAAVRRLARATGVELIASPAALAPHLRDAALAVAPIRIAAGLQNKVLEAMASGLAVVATPQANEGIRALPGREIVLAADADSFAREVIALLVDPLRRFAIGNSARARVERSFSWERHFWRLERGLERLVQATRATQPRPT